MGKKEKNKLERVTEKAVEGSRVRKRRGEREKE